jgi:hypothetical protein
MTSSSRGAQLICSPPEMKVIKNFNMSDLLSRGCLVDSIYSHSFIELYKNVPRTQS